MIKQKFYGVIYKYITTFNFFDMHMISIDSNKSKNQLNVKISSRNMQWLIISELRKSTEIQF